MRIFFAGATGVIGRRLLPLLIRHGHQVIAVTRSREHMESIRAHGAEPLLGDVFDSEWLNDAVRRAKPDAVMHQLTSIPRRLNPRRVGKQMAQTNRLRTEGTQNLMKAAQSAEVSRFVAQSIAFAYAPTGSPLATEDDPLYLDFHPAGEIIKAVDVLEHTVTNTLGVDGIILRYGFFYGPGTIYDWNGSFAEDVRRRRVPIIGDGGGVFSFIHVDDAAAATAVALEHDEPGLYNIVDDEPAPVREWLPWYAELLGAPRPFRVPKFIGHLIAGPYATHMMTTQRGASNEKAKQRLRWAPKYASWRHGFRSELSSQAFSRSQPKFRQP